MAPKVSRTVGGKVQDYMQDKAMDHLLKNTIIYNVAWEVRALAGKNFWQLPARLLQQPTQAHHRAPLTRVFRCAAEWIFF